MTENELSKIILDSAIQVHRTLGPGLLESAYQRCLAFELEQQELQVEVERGLPLIYKEVKMEVGYRVNIFVNQTVIIEIKSVDALNDIHLAQVLTYLKLSDSKLGLLIYFNTKLLKDGFRRVVNNL
jgi:GxxExxY protein